MDIPNFKSWEVLYTCLVYGPIYYRGDHLSLECVKLNSVCVCVCVYVSTIDAELKRHHSFADEAPQGGFAPRK